jgi:hypothetical protein
LSSASSDFFGVNTDAEPNPPIVDGADHALALLVPLVNPPKRGFAVPARDSSFLVGVDGLEDVKEPKILVDLSETVLAALDAAFVIASRGVAASTLTGVADAGDDDSSGLNDAVSATAAAAVVEGVLVSSMPVASLLTPDMVMMAGMNQRLVMMKRVRKNRNCAVCERKS